MRVVIVSDFATVNGGAAKVAIESARGLAEAGADIVFACAIAPVSERLTHPNIAVELFGADEVWKVGGRLAAARQGIWNDAAHGWLSALLARQPAGTVVHLHQWTKAFSPAAIAAAAGSGLPVMVTMHDYFSFCPVGGYFDYKASEPCTRAPMGAACMGANCDRASYAHKLVRVARQWRSDRALAACRDLTFIHVSAFARRFAEPFLPATARHVTIENMTAHPAVAASALSSRRHAVYLGRLTEEKGVLVLAEAARRAAVPVRFVGEGPMAAEIARLNPDAELTGWVDAERAEAEIAAARVLAAPSLWYETGPMTVVEAMACGIPAIVSASMGASGWVEDGVTGRHVPAADVAALAAALKEAMGEAAGPWGEAAQARWQADPFTLERHVQRLCAAYQAGQGLRAAA